MRRIAIPVAAGLLAAALAGPAFSQDKPAPDKPVELRFSHWVPPGHPMHPAVEAWAESIKAASNGTITIKIYPAQQLGKAFDHYNMAKDGIADFAHVNPGYEPGRFPIMGASELPFLLANSTAGSAGIDAWYRKYADKEMKDVKYCLTFMHDPATFHTTNKKVMVPGDVKGMKIRPANATISRFISLLGGTNVPASAPESRDLLEKGVAEGITFPWGSIVLFGIDKVTKYHLDSALYATEQTFVMNKDKYNSLSPAQRKVIDDHCTPEWSEKIATPWAKMESGGRDKIKAQAGKEVYTITPAQLAEWRKAAEPLKKEWEAQVKKAGGDPDAIFKDLQDELKKRNSLY
jgi:TRAP-type C4-dicarboxylate transport system substrate-binding protein